MKLPILKATSFNHIIKLGGHSKPWIVSTQEGSYVTKLYKTIDLEARNKMTAEVLGNLLAKEFDFNVPKAAIIEFDDNFRMSLGMEYHCPLMHASWLAFASCLICLFLS